MPQYGPLIDGLVAPSTVKANTDPTRDYGSTAAANTGSFADQATYGVVKSVFDSGGSVNDAGTAALGTQTLGGSNIVTAPKIGADPIQLALQAGGQVVGGYVIDPVTGNAVGRVPTAPTISVPPGGVAPTSTSTTSTGGDGGGSTDTTTAPTGTTDLQGASIAAVEGQIAALEAQYGLDLASIAALGGEIGAQAQFLLSQLQRDQQFAQEDLIGNLVARGVLRSGITARDTGRLQGDFAQQRAEVEMNKASRLRQLAERAGAASASLGQGKADVIANIDQGNLQTEIRQSLLNELQSLTPEDIQAALNAAYSGNEAYLTNILDTTGQGGLNLAGADAQQAISSYDQVVGGYGIDPNTGLAAEYLGGEQPTGVIPRTDGTTIDPEELNRLLQSGQISGFGNALNRGLTGF